MYKFLFALIILHFSSLAFATPNFSGEWNTTYGLMKLTQSQDKVDGFYNMGGVENKISGVIKGKRFEFTYKESHASGKGWFELNANGASFSGEWQENGRSQISPWVGKRYIDPKEDFAGVWETSFGRMRLVEKTKNEIHGVFAWQGISTLKGKRENKKFIFTYEEKKASGEGWFELSADGLAISGKWREKGKEKWQDWNGVRVRPIPGRVWLYVVEARWERLFEQKEYAFGDMLKAFFDRTPNVEVRRRFFTDATSLDRWLSEIALVPEPVLLSLASHGETDGLRVDGHIISSEIIAQSLKNAENLIAIHFSSCLIMKNNYGKELKAALSRDLLDLPISGYQTSVDWSASAIFEMTYFDLILSRGLSPKEAAKAALQLFPIAGKKPIAGVPISPAGFEIIL